MFSDDEVQKVEADDNADRERDGGPISGFPDFGVDTEAVNGLTKIANRAGRGYSFETIRAKALLMEPGKLRQCPYCKGEYPEGGFRAPVITCPPDENGHVKVLEGLDPGCGNCHYVFHHIEWEVCHADDEEYERMQREADNSTSTRKFIERRVTR